MLKRQIALYCSITVDQPLLLWQILRFLNVKPIPPSKETGIKYLLNKGHSHFSLNIGLRQDLVCVSLKETVKRPTNCVLTSRPVPFIVPNRIIISAKYQLEAATSYYLGFTCNSIPNFNYHNNPLIE